MSALLSIAQVIALAEGSWVDAGFKATVESVEPVPMKKGGNFYKATLSDGPGTEALTMSLFAPPKFGPGDTIEVVGKGIKRKAFNGHPEVGTSKETAINIGQKSHARVLAVASGAVRVGEQHSAPQAGQVNNGTIKAQGQSIGMAIKEALAIHGSRMANVADLCSPNFWDAVHETASDILRLSNRLEQGDLAKPVDQRTDVEY